MVYKITCNGKSVEALSFGEALDLAKELAKQHNEYALIYWAGSTNVRYRVCPEGIIEKAEERCTCDFCQLCYYGGPSDCPMHPTSWVEWEVYEE